MNMSKTSFITTLPNLGEVPFNSFCWFLKYGLSEELEKFSTINALNGNLQIRIYGDEYAIKRPKYSVSQCKKYALTYSLRLYIAMELIDQVKVTESVAFLGEIPLMTDMGTFIINGCERVVINQLIRSPGVYVKQTVQKRLQATLILLKNDFINFEVDKNNLIWIKLRNEDKIDAASFFHLHEISKVKLSNKNKFSRFRTQSQNAFLKYSQPTPISKKSLDSFKSFLLLFNKKLYPLGAIGRLKLNHRFNNKISQSITYLTPNDIISIFTLLEQFQQNFEIFDDIDNLKNKRVRSVGEILQLQFNVGLNRLRKIIAENLMLCNPDLLKPYRFINSKPILLSMKEFFASSQLSQYMDQTNPLASLTHRRRLTGLGPGGLTGERLSVAVRDLHTSFSNRICPVETPEGQNVGLLASLATYTRVNEYGFLETPYFKVKNRTILKKSLPQYLTLFSEETLRIASADTAINKRYQIIKQEAPILINQQFTLKPSKTIDIVAVSPFQLVSISTSLIPFFEHNDSNRTLMGANMQRQSVPLLYPNKPIVGTGLENQLALDCGTVVLSKSDGIVAFVSTNQIRIKKKEKKQGNNFNQLIPPDFIEYSLEKFITSNQDTCINQRPIVWLGENVTKGQIIADGPSTDEGELALGQNILVAYMAWDGYNFEDALLINERLVIEDIFTSIHIKRYEIEIRETQFGIEQVTRNLPQVSEIATQFLDDQGIVKKGTFVKSGDILVGKVTPKSEADQIPEGKLLGAIFGEKNTGVWESSLRVSSGNYGRVLDLRMFRRERGYALREGTLSLIRIFLAQIRKVQVGDKISGRHGNKGIVSKIVPQRDMPFLPDGTPIDLILNPLGVPSRMNVGQLFECLLGFAGHQLNQRFKICPFDEMYGVETSRTLIINTLKTASKNKAWVFNPNAPGRINLIDGRSGKYFDNPILVGNAYMLKLIHQVNDKIHARSTGPYSLITQQPLGGKAHRGGQRFGEMEVWALQAFGSAYTLQELLTYKSDDLWGRHCIFDAIVNGTFLPKPSLPESFNVLFFELYALGLDIGLYQLIKTNPLNRNQFKRNLIKDLEIAANQYPIYNPQ
jgi:DNA-directed RNA polymerase subunit beta